MSPAAAVRAVELVAAPCAPEDVENRRGHARAMAGLERSRIQIAVTGEGGSGESQASLVRKAAGRNPLVLIVEPADPADAELARAVDEARARGIPVVVMGRPLAVKPEAATAREAEKSKGSSAGAGAGPLITTFPQPFADSARQLVEAAVNNASNIGFQPEGGAILVIDRRTDSLGESRLEAMRAALREAGVAPVKEVTFNGEYAEAKQKVQELIKAEPKIGIVVATDHPGLTGAFQVSLEIGDDRKFVVAGYSREDSSAGMAQGGEYAAAAIYAPERLLRKTIAVATAAARGEKQPDLVEVMVPVHVSPRSAGAPKMYKKFSARRRSGPEPKNEAPKE
ncbi:MAG: substrate-binding domain-containing protein [Isosphaeraceae bacterium]